MSDEKAPKGTEHGEVTTQPAISKEEAAKTDEVLSPVGDKKVVLDGDVEEADRVPE